MSRKYPTRDVLEWDFQKGNLNEPTKKYSLQAASIASKLGGQIHFFCVGRVLEQANIDWLTRSAITRTIMSMSGRPGQSRHSSGFNDPRG